MTLSHVDPETNQPAMVDVGDKAVTERRAVAETVVQLTPEIMVELDGDEIRTKKGPVFQTAVIAGTMAVKQTAQWIPFCHPLPIESIQFEIRPEDGNRVRIRCAVRVTWKTGVEMEALTGASAAALTIYDMCKAISHEIEIQHTRLVEKTGGKSDTRR